MNPTVLRLIRISEISLNSYHCLEYENTRNPSQIEGPSHIENAFHIENQIQLSGNDVVMSVGFREPLIGLS